MNYYIICVKGNFEHDLGEIVSVHREFTAMSNKYSKFTFDDKRNYRELQSEDKFKKGEIHEGVATLFLEKEVEAYLTDLCLKLIEGEELQQYEMDTLVLDHDLTVEKLLAQYEEKAFELRKGQETEKSKQREKMARLQAAEDEVEDYRQSMCISFPAVRANQAGKEFYTAQVPFKHLVKLFTFTEEEEEVGAQHRYQRKLNPKHAKDIATYMTDNPDTYVLPSLTVSVSQSMHFESVENKEFSNLGLLRIPMDATILINDGQHRQDAIRQVLRSSDKYRFAEDSVSVTFFFDQGLKSSQQMFADINASQSKPTSAISTTFEHRNPFVLWMKEMVGRLNITPLIEYEKGAVGAKSSKVWSITNFEKFLTELTGLNRNNFDSRVEEFGGVEEVSIIVKEYWKDLDNLPGWKEMLSGTSDLPTLRNEKIISHAVFLQSLAIVGKLIAVEMALPTDCSPMKLLDLSKDAPDWQGRCVIMGRMQPNATGAKLTANVILKALKFPLSADLSLAEQEFESSKAA